MKRLLYWMRHNAFVLAALLVAGSTACHRQSSPTVFVDPALAALVPNDTIMLAGARMEQLARTKFWNDYVTKGRVPVVEKFRKQTGLDLARDFWELLIASSARSTLVLVRGKFSDMGMEPKLEREGAQRFSYKGFTLIGDDNYAVLFLNPSTAAAGSTDALRQLVDNRNNITGLPAFLDERIKKIPSTNQAWFVAKLGAGLLPDMSGVEAGAFTGLFKIARSVEFATGALDLRSEFDSRIDLQTADPQSADRLGNAIRGLLGLGRLNTGDKQREILSVYDGMHVTRENAVVHFSTQVPYSVLEKAAAELPLFGVR